MKNNFFIIVILLIINAVSYSQVDIKTGDLLFVGIPLDYTLDNSDMSDAIVKSTGKTDEINYIHVAILEVDSINNIWIIDATIKHGVDRHPLDTFLTDFTLKNGKLPQLDVMRLKNNEDCRQYIENSLHYCGLGYDVYFLPDNNLYYCSELVRDSYIKRNGKHIFKAKPMNFKSQDGTYPTYWVQLFSLIGQEIPQGVLGTNPNDMSKEKSLKRVGELKIDR